MEDFETDTESDQQYKSTGVQVAIHNLIWILSCQFIKISVSSQIEAVSCKFDF